MKKEKPVNILLTSAGRRSYLVKYFQEAVKGNGKIHAANSFAASTALEAADQAVVTPIIHSDTYISFLMEYCIKNQITAVIPLFDIDLMVLSQCREEFEKAGIELIVSDYKMVEICNDKWKTYEFLKKNGFDVLPSFCCLQDALEALENGRTAYPLIIKPRWGMGSLAVYEAENERELRVLFKKVKREIFHTYLKYESSADMQNSVLIQQKADGQEYGLDIISDLSGNYCTTIVKKKEWMRSGETDCATTVSMPGIEAVGKRLAAVSGHRANMDADLIVCGKNMYILDMNARFGGGYPFSHAAGVNLPQAIVMWLQKKEVPTEILTPEIGITALKEIQIVKGRTKD